ncbi:MAG: hypothetical protein B6U78_00185 [Candidatus Aenigmarchaeota archaeon ex4484_224]|nr:MAG: hypothetical protein B6U78_00185 [Candidatus Aenigmarchaeota archaeon ex4484_224]
MVNWDKFKTFVFDLDGVIWNYPEVIEGADRVINRLKEIGKQVLIITNYTSLSRENLVKELRKRGIEIEKEEIINPCYVLALNLKGNERVLVIGNEAKKDLEEFNVNVVDDLPADILFVTHDMQFNYEKLVLGFKALINGAKFFASSLDKEWLHGKERVPGTGALVKAFEYCSNVKAELIGKPSEYMRFAMELNVLSPRKEVVYFGDQLDKDIAFAKKSKYFTVWVLSGIGKKEDLKKSKAKPNLILKSLKEVKI